LTIHFKNGYRDFNPPVETMDWPVSKKFICCLLIAFSGLSLSGRIDKLRVAGEISLFEETRASEPDDPEEPEEPDDPDEPEED
jgi:hypothetical protein